LRLGDGTVARQLIPRARYMCGVIYNGCAVSARWRQPGGMIRPERLTPIDASRFLATNYS
jgi:hypothetical protein